MTRAGRGEDGPDRPIERRLGKRRGRRHGACGAAKGRGLSLSPVLPATTTDLPVPAVIRASDGTGPPLRLPSRLTRRLQPPDSVLSIPFLRKSVLPPLIVCLFFIVWFYAAGQEVDIPTSATLGVLKSAIVADGEVCCRQTRYNCIFPTHDCLHLGSLRTARFTCQALCPYRR